MIALAMDDPPDHEIPKEVISLILSAILNQTYFLPF